MERKYSISEINRMRECIRWSYPSNTPYFPEERNKDIEIRLQTYMLNGTDPQELEMMMKNHFAAEQSSYALIQSS